MFQKRKTFVFQKEETFVFQKEETFVFQKEETFVFQKGKTFVSQKEETSAFPLDKFQGIGYNKQAVMIQRQRVALQKALTAGNPPPAEEV